MSSRIKYIDFVHPLIQGINNTLRVSESQFKDFIFGTKNISLCAEREKDRCYLTKSIDGNLTIKTKNEQLKKSLCEIAFSSCKPLEINICNCENKITKLFTRNDNIGFDGMCSFTLSDIGINDGLSCALENEDAPICFGGLGTTESILYYPVFTEEIECERIEEFASNELIDVRVECDDSISVFNGWCEKSRTFIGTIYFTINDYLEVYDVIYHRECFTVPIGEAPPPGNGNPYSISIDENGNQLFCRCPNSCVDEDGNSIFRYRNGRRWGDVITNTLLNAFNCGLPLGEITKVQSLFFGINNDVLDPNPPPIPYNAPPDKTGNNINYAYLKADYYQNIAIHRTSDVKRPFADNVADKDLFCISFKELQEILWCMFRACISIKGDTVRIEHISLFEHERSKQQNILNYKNENHQSLAISTIENSTYNKIERSFDSESPNIDFNTNNTYSLSDIAATYIGLKGCGTETDNCEIPLTNTDVCDISANPDNYPDAGFVLISRSFSNHPQGMNQIINEEGAISGVNQINAPLSLANTACLLLSCGNSEYVSQNNENIEVIDTCYSIGTTQISLSECCIDTECLGEKGIVTKVNCIEGLKDKITNGRIERFCQNLHTGKTDVSVIYRKVIV